jgi:hypothetical protein
VTEAADEALKLPPVDRVRSVELRSGGCELGEDEAAFVGGADKEAAADIRLQPEGDHGRPSLEFFHGEDEAKEAELACRDGGMC